MGSDKFYVYMLQCSDGTYYVGHTDELGKRLNEHFVGKYGGYTSKRLPVELVFVQAMATRNEAFYAERKIKNWSHAKKEALIVKNWNLISELAKKKF